MNACNPKEYTSPGFDSRQADLATQRQPTPLRLAPVGDKTVALDFDGGRFSSDAGLVLRKEIDDQLGLTRALAAVLADARDARRIHFPPEDIRKQRIVHIAAGYEEANDANTVRHDPIFTLLLDRLPETGAPLASQPTRSRFENSVSRTEMSRMALVLMEQCIASYNSPPEVIVLDVDDTEDRAPGAQEPIRYDGSYGGECFMPFHLYEGLSGRLSTTLLKAKRFSGAPMLAVLTRVVQRLRHAWPDTWCIFRGDSHFASPEVMAWIEAQAHRHSVTGLTGNAVLQKLAHAVIEQATRASARWGRKAPRVHSTRSQAGTWSRSRRVVSKVEVSEQGVNTRFVVTDRAQARPQVRSRHISCGRGHRENKSKDHKLSLQSARTSCHRFEANHVRLFLHAAASVRLDTLRREV